jgi:acyl-coenzyme A thioesterase PaaI-like protein
MERRANNPEWLSAIRAGVEIYEPNAALCGACSRTGQCHLGLELHSTERGVRGTATAPPSWTGSAGAAHGGWTAAVLDEALGHAVLSRGYTAVTQTITVDYLRPVPVGVCIDVEGWVLDCLPDGRWRVAGEVSFNGQVLARARALWVSRDLVVHAGKHRDWRDSHNLEI